jgi:hypothetical protein
MSFTVQLCTFHGSRAVAEAGARMLERFALIVVAISLFSTIAYVFDPPYIQ